MCRTGSTMDTSRSGGGSCHRVVPEPLPLAWRQLQDQSRRMRQHAVDHIAQIHKRVELQVLTGLPERTQDGRAVRSCFAARKQISLPAQDDRPQSLLSAVIVNSEAPVVGVTRQRGPIAQRVADGGTEGALR